jgi:hypothetical protein
MVRVTSIQKRTGATLAAQTTAVALSLRDKQCVRYQDILLNR